GSVFGAGPRRRWQTAHRSAPRYVSLPDLSDLTAPPRKNIVPRVTSTPHEQSLALRSDRKRHTRPSVEDLRTVPGIASARRVPGPDGSRTPPFLRVGHTATDRLDDSSLDLPASARPPGFHRLECRCR